MEDYQKIIFEILGNKPIAFNPILARICGSVKAGLFLSQLLYWQGKTEEEWIYKTIDEFEEETALSRNEQDSAIRRLKQLGILTTEVRGIPAKRHFRINFSQIIELLKKYQSVCEKPANKFVENQQTSLRKTSKLNTYNTTDNTTDIINNINNISMRLKKKYSSLKDITDQDLAEIAERYKVSLGFVKLQFEKMKNWCQAKGKRYKDYKHALRNWVLMSLERQAERRANDTKRAIDARNI